MKANAALAPEGSHEKWAPLLEVAAREVFERMLGTQLTVPDTAAEIPPHDVIAMVGLAGKLCGVLRVQCTENGAALMTSKMLGVLVEKGAPEVSDALGEIGNMVAGNFKNKIAGLGDGCMLSPPAVITGGDYALHSPTDSPGLEVRLLFEGLPILITLQIHT
jgi:chemotaxis protein CheX